jgi:hypothetical protein
MSELYLEILKNSTLNRNTSTLVESYLLDPPILPFLCELREMTSCISDDTKYVQYYTSYSVEYGYNNYCETLLGKYKISHDYDWFIGEY